jgi:preprotein translocase subunit SecG
MMLFFIILLSVIMILDCIVLCFLVLMQLPKKEAGAGLAFGAGATDALFGAGSGNFLTKATKYCAGIFFALAIFLSWLQTARAHQPGSDFLKRVQEQQNAGTAIKELPAAPANSQAAPSTQQPMSAPGTNGLMIPPVESAGTNAAPHLAIPTNAEPAPASQPK